VQMLGPSLRFVGLMGVLLATALAACGSAPEEQSGGDAYRNEATPMPLDEWTTGELNLDGGDMTDWKSIDVESAGKLVVELKADKKGAVVLVGVYDKHGLAIGNGTRKAGSDGVTVPVKATYGGRYFVKIVHKDGDKTAYSVRAVMGDGGGGGDVVPDL